MNLQKIIVCTLKRRPDKLHAWLGAIQTSMDLRKPTDLPANIEIHYGVDGNDYTDTRHVISEAQQEFSWWGDLTDEWIDAGWHGKGTLCCIWSFQQILKRIAGDPNLNNIYLMSVDRYWLEKKWDQLESIFAKIPYIDILQLHYWYHNVDKPHDNAELWEYLPYHTVHKKIETETRGIYHGLAGAGDSMNAIGPNGAKMILDWYAESPHHMLEILLAEHAHDPLEHCFFADPWWEWSQGPLRTETWTGMTDSERVVLDGGDGKGI